MSGFREASLLAQAQVFVGAIKVQLAIAEFEL